MPDAFVGRHLDTMLRGPLASAFVFGAQSTRCLWDDDGAIVSDASGRNVPVRSRVAVIRTGTVTGILEGVTVSVDGVAYEVCAPPLPMDDGQLTRVAVSRADW